MCEDFGLPLLVSRETVFVFGGSNPFSDTIATGQKIFKYQAQSNSWRNCGKMPEPLYYHSALYFGNKIYIAGGKLPSKRERGGGPVSRQMWRYDPSEKKWCRMKDMLHARRSFCFVALQKKLYAIGGRDDSDRILASVEKFDTCLDSWVEVRPLSVGRAGAAAAVFRGCIWVAGGIISETIAANTVECYNPQQNVWVECGNLRYTLALSTMVPVEDRLYLVGGAIGLQDAPVTGSGKQIDVWDPQSQTWCLASMMSKPRHAHAAVFLRSELPQPGQMFIMGGLLSKHNCVTDHVECWREVDDQWVTGVAPLPHAVCGLAALALPYYILD